MMSACGCKRSLPLLSRNHLTAFAEISALLHVDYRETQFFRLAFCPPSHDTSRITQQTTCSVAGPAGDNEGVLGSGSDGGLEAHASDRCGTASVRFQTAGGGCIMMREEEGRPVAPSLHAGNHCIFRDVTARAATRKSEDAVAVGVVSSKHLHSSCHRHCFPPTGSVALLPQMLQYPPSSMPSRVPVPVPVGDARPPAAWSRTAGTRQWTSTAAPPFLSLSHRSPAPTGSATTAWHQESQMDHQRFLSSPPTSSPPSSSPPSSSTPSSSTPSSSPPSSSPPPSWFSLAGLQGLLGRQSAASETTPPLTASLNEFANQLKRARQFGQLTTFGRGLPRGGEASVVASLKRQEDIARALASAAEGDSEISDAHIRHVSNGSSNGFSIAEVAAVASKFEWFAAAQARVQQRKEEGKPLPTTFAEVEQLMGGPWRPPPSPSPSHTASGGTSTAVSLPRNAPCPCGSGRRYKRCCGAAASASA